MVIQCGREYLTQCYNQEAQYYHVCAEVGSQVVNLAILQRRPQVRSMSKRALSARHVPQVYIGHGRIQTAASCTAPANRPHVCGKLRTINDDARDSQ